MNTCTRKGYQTATEAYEKLAMFRRKLKRQDLFAFYCKPCKKWHLSSR